MCWLWHEASICVRSINFYSVADTCYLLNRISATFKKEIDKFVKTGFMTTTSIRQKLHNYLEIADDKK